MTEARQEGYMLCNSVYIQNTKSTDREKSGVARAGRGKTGGGASSQWSRASFWGGENVHKLGVVAAQPRDCH